jgi:hypothetical protein
MPRARALRTVESDIGKKLMNDRSGNTTDGSVALCRRATELLGWEGAVIPSLELLGSRVCVVASLNMTEHEDRQEAGIGALTDPWMLEFHEGPTPERVAQWRASPVRIVGVLALRQTWRSALTTASGFAAFSSRAVVLPSRQALNRRLGLEANLCGVGIVARGPQGLALVHRPAPGSARQADRSLAHRLVEETVYGRLMASLIEAG